MYTHGQIIKGEVTYTLEEFYQELKDFIYQIKMNNDKKKEKGFHSLFLFIMLSAEDKSIETMIEVFHNTKEHILEGKEAFKEHIDVCRAIHMKKYLDIYTEYYAGTTMTLQILNAWIQDFLKKHIPMEEGEHGTA